MSIALLPLVIVLGFIAFVIVMSIAFEAISGWIKRYPPPCASPTGAPGTVQPDGHRSAGHGYHARRHLTHCAGRAAMIFAWTRGARGPEPSRCDGDSILTLRKYLRVMIEHPIPDDCADCPLDALALRFPAPPNDDH